MRWQVKSRPDEGDTKIARRFLWLPHKAPSNGKTEWRWLERATMEYVYYRPPLKRPRWLLFRFIDNIETLHAAQDWLVDNFVTYATESLEKLNDQIHSSPDAKPAGVQEPPAHQD